MLFSFLKSDPGDVSGYPIVKHGKLSLVDLAGKNIKKKNEMNFVENGNQRAEIYLFLIRDM